MSPNPNVDRIRATIDARAAELGKSLTDVAKDAGITEEGLRAIRAGDVTRPRTRTLHGLDRALAYRPGSTARLFDGGTPTPLDAAPPKGSVDDAENRILAMEHLTEPEKELLISTIREASRTTLARAKRLNEQRRGA